MGRHSRTEPSTKPPGSASQIRRLRSGIVCNDVSVEFDRFRLGPLSINFAAGSISCLVGPNGSGKTTLARAMMGLLKHHSGQVLYDAVPMSSRSRSLLRLIGFVPDGPENLIQDLTAEELWELQALAHSRVTGTVDEIMARAVQLAEVLDFPPPRTAIRSYSHGMQKKTQLVAGLMHSPEYLLLDEPRNGLDPIAGERLDKLIDEECSRGRTIVVATHDLRYAERVAHSVVILNRGKLTASGPPRYLRRENEQNFVETFFRLVDGGS